MGLASRGGTPLRDLALRRIPGAPGQNLDPGLNPALGVFPLEWCGAQVTQCSHQQTKIRCSIPVWVLSFSSRIACVGRDEALGEGIVEFQTLMSTELMMSRSRRSSRRHYTRSRSRSRSHRRSRSRSYSRDYRRRHSHSHSPMSTRRRHIGNRANPDPNCCLGVFGLSLYTTERDLREVFSKYGPIADVSIVYDQQSRRSRGFAFVYFENVEDAKEAKERANGMELDGRRIRVDFSITKRPHTPTPGIYMGRPTYGSSRRRDYYDRGYDRGYDDRDYYSRSYRGGGGGGGGGWRAVQDRDQFYRCVLD
ncbi:hypothetical protein EK904_000393 [Melospiza melodia maxima]|nr:hypothetical protein EK904_000393 [Melospiza melodia maxima]